MTTRISKFVRVAAAIVLVGLTVEGSASAFARVPSATTTINLGLIQGTDFTHAMPSRVADAEGYFRKAKLDVKIVAFTSGSDLVKAMAGGSIDIGAATGLDVATANAHAIRLQAFYGVASSSPITVIAKRSAGITSLARLKGKKVGISAFGSFTDFTAKSIVREEHFGSGDLTEVPLGAPPTNIAALQSGQVDAILLPIEFVYVLRASGQDVTEIRTSHLKTPSQFAVLMASPSYLSSNGRAVKRFLHAYYQASTFIRTKSHRSATVAVAVQQLGQTQSVANQSYKAVAGLFTPNGKINTAGLTAYAKALPVLGISTTVPTLREMYTSKFVPVK